MGQPYYARKVTLQMGERKGETVYCAQVTYYGTISSKQMAKQIAEESTLTEADVQAVFNRLAFFCQQHLSLGYRVYIEGLGSFQNELLTKGSVATAKEVTNKLIKSVRPSFKPEYTIMNGVYRYALMPEKTELVKVSFSDEDADEDDSTTGGEGTEDSDTSGGTTNPDDNVTEDPLA